MFWEIACTATSVVAIIFGVWSLIRLLKERQAADDHKYDGGSGGICGGGGGCGGGTD
jgi:hypothetical protein